MTQCPTCGSNVPDNAEICPDCGMDLNPATPSAPAATPPVAPAPVQLDKDADFSFDFDASSSAPPAPAMPQASFDEPARTVVLDPAPQPVAPAPLAPVPSSTQPQASLTIKRGGSLTGERFVVGASASIGRFDPDSGPVDVDMASLPEASYVSRHHAELRCDAGGQWFVKDLGSRNGTFVRSGGASFTRVAGEQALSDGDEISLGNARFEFRIGA